VNSHGYEGNAIVSAWTKMNVIGKHDENIPVIP
jgi:hypothetical protein